MFTPETAPYWSDYATGWIAKHPWMADLVQTNREQAALVILQNLKYDLRLARSIHDQLTGCHKLLQTHKPETLTPWAMEPAFRARACRIPNLHVISPALAEALMRMELESQPSNAH